MSVPFKGCKAAFLAEDLSIGIAIPDNLPFPLPGAWYCSKSALRIHMLLDGEALNIVYKEWEESPFIYKILNIFF